MRLGVACASIVALLAASGCTGSDPAPDTTTLPDTVTTLASPSPHEVDPTIPVAPSQAAGIPTAKPSPATTPNPTALNASALITLATVDPDSGGLLVGGYVTGVIEDGGDCQYVITPASGDALIIHKDGVENNGSTSCGSTTIAKSRVPAGSYTVALRYANDKGEVVSDAVKVVVP